MKTRSTNKFKKRFTVPLALLLNLLIGLNAFSQVNCTCPGNLVLNPSFENGTTNWHWTGGNFSTGNGAVACGSKSGDFQITNTSNNYVSQTIGTDLIAGTILNATVYAGVHDNSFNAYVGIAFFDASWNYLSSSVSVEVNKILANSPVGPQLYTFTATVPVGAKYSQASYGANGNWIKTDNWCITTAVGSGSIGDRVWLDANGNGIQDVSETGGITGVSVQLKNNAGVVIATRTTNSTGNYLFNGLIAGNYTVVFPTNISGTIVTPQNVGSNDAIDSDASPTTGSTAIIALATGQNITNVDAGYCPTTLELGNRVWYDTNNNGINSNENGIAGVMVRIYKDDNNDNAADGASIATTTTDADGFYNFANLGPGNYIVGVVTPAGYISSSVNGGDPDNNINLDDNGQVIVGNETRGLAITLIAGTEPDGANTNTNNNATYDFGFLPDCACTNSTGNLLVNGNFENGTNGWIWNGGTLSTGTGYVACGVANGFNNWSSGTSRVYQDVNVVAGATVTFTAFAGTHTPGLACSPTLSLIYLNATGGVISQSNVTVTRDVNVNFNQLAQYTITGVTPVGTTKVRVQSSITCNTMKMDAFCLTATPPPCPLAPTSYHPSVCEGNGLTLTATGATGAIFKWYATPTSALVLATGSGYPTGNLTSTTSFYATQTINGCESPRAQFLVTVNLKPVITECEANNGAGWVVIPSCSISVLEGTSLILSVNPNTFNGGTQLWNGPNGYTATGNVATISSTITLSQAGNYIITVTDVNGCVNTKTITVIVVRPITIGNLVWYDQNNDGIKQATEIGIANATVNLYADANNDNVADGAAIATTTTSTTGLYSFTNLLAGNYIVGIIIPTGYAVVSTNGGDPDNNIDNDNNGTNTSVAGEVRSAAITVTVGTEPDTAVDGDGTNGNLTLDFGLRGTGSIGDLVFNDANGNGIQDVGETGISGATVTLTYPNGATLTTTTNASGIYSFANLAPGTYSVAFTTPAGFTATTPNVGANDAVDSDPIGGIVTGIVLTAGQVNTTVDAGFYQLVNLGNTVWNDQNNDGIKQTAETGISSATVRLYADANNDNIADAAAVATVTTDANGLYNFTNLAPGNYIVGVTIPTGYAVVSTNGGDPDNNIDNDNNGTNTSVAGEVRSAAITLSAGTEPTTDGDGANGNLTLDFGLRGTGSIGDLVFNDANSNGIQDVGETGISGATVTLTYPNGATLTTTTNASGIYSFANLAPGTYSVAFTTPAGGYLVSPSNAGGNDAVDSDPIGGIVSGIVLTAGQLNTTIDAGFYLCPALNSGINGPTTICAAEPALFTATGAGSGSVYNWTFMSGTPATAIGSSVTSTWNTPGEYDITLTVTKNGCTATYIRSIVITQSVFAGAGPDADICSGSSTTLVGSGPLGSNYSWTVVSGDPTSIDNGANQSSVLVSPLVTTTYQLTVSQNGCTRIDQVTVFINVNKNPVANAGPNKVTLINTPVTIGGSPTGTPPLATPTAALGYIWSPATGLNSTSIPNPSATITIPGVYNYQVIVFSILTGCSDTANVSVTAVQPVNVGNTVFYDKNNNGIKDATDNGILGATVRLYKDDNNDNIADGVAIATTTTSEAGLYNFANLYPGNYIVGVLIPAGYAVVTTNGGDPDNNIDNDNNGTNTSVTGEVRSLAVTLTAGDEPNNDGDGNNGNLTVDFAFRGTGSIGDFVWNDANRNGVQDAGEPGIPNATVTLTFADGSTMSTFTSATGAYTFPNLAPGTYSLSFSTPANFSPTLSNVNSGGGTDSNDSDPINGTVTGINLTPGQINNTVDAGFFAPINISGNVWHDANALIDNQVNKTSNVAIPVGLNIYLVDDATGLIVQSENILSNGTYSFLDVEINTSFRIVLSSIVRGVGQQAPPSILPSGWRNTGENLGAGSNSGSDGVVNGVLFIDTIDKDVINANFGIRIKNGEVVIG